MDTNVDMKLLVPFLSVFLFGFLVSCSTSPQTRIEKNPGAFSGLNATQKNLVQRGRITKGMPKAGVFLAMGKPDNTSYGAGPSAEYEQWEYYTLEPVTTYRFSTYYGNRWGRDYCGRRRGYGGFGWGPTIHYLPKKSASVRFENGLVQEFKSAGQSLF